MSKAVVKFAQSFVNRNPRNLEQLRLRPKPTGWPFERNRDERHNIYRVEFRATKKHTTGVIIHCDDGVVLSASTNEPFVAAQLHSCADVSAATNVGRLLARRCHMAGITAFHALAFDAAEEESRRVGAIAFLADLKLSFFHALHDSGLRLREPPTIPHTHRNDPELTWTPFTVKQTRTTKLDELDLSLEPGRGVC